jgi:putative ABC transport system permease protein
MLKTYWLIAVRKMLRYKLQSIINIVGLTIGIATCLIIFLLSRTELSYDTFHPNKDRIYRVVAEETDNGNSARRGFLLAPLPITLRDEGNGGQTCGRLLQLLRKGKYSAKRRENSKDRIG